MKPEETIDRIKELLSKQNYCHDGNLYSFKYTANINSVDETYKLETNPCITICGKESIDTYHALFNDLLNCICTKKKVSLKAFMDATQNLIFENRFNVSEIKTIIDGLEELNVINIRKVFGLATNTPEIKLGPFAIVKKDCIERHFDNAEFGQDFDWFRKEFIKRIRKDATEKENFVYVLYEQQVFDNIISKIDCNRIIEEFVRIVRYIIGIKHERVLIDSKPFATYIENSTQIINHNRLNLDSHVVMKDIPIYIDDSFIINKELGHNKIWDIFSLENKNEMQLRILQAIFWIGESDNEIDSNKVVAEIAFAFETLLHCNNEVFASKGVVASLSEAYAFINGNSVEERISLEKEFKDFYKKRSTISHGARISKEKDNVNSYYKMIYSTIKNLLIKPEFANCTSSEQLYSSIQKMRYSG